MTPNPHPVARSPWIDRRSPVLVALTAVLALLIASCGTSQDSAAEYTDCITDYQPGVDYFDDKLTVTDSENFTISYHDSYQVLTVDEPYPGGAPQSYVLVRCGAPAPELTGDLADAEQITTPVRTMFAGSTTQLPYLIDLDRLPVLTGINTDLVASEAVAQRIADGEVAVYGDGAVINTELVVADHPDVLLTDGYENDAYPKIRQAGIPVIAGADWLEPTPLGRAEWIKVIGALTGTEAQAATLFEERRTAYLRTAQRAAALPDVKTLYGTMFQGTWYMPSGGGYTGALLRDAGAEWPWQDSTGTDSLTLDFESVYTRAGDSPVWLMVEGGWQNLSDVLAADRNYASLAAFRSGNVWNGNREAGANGGSAYFERGAARPDLVLADLVAILHPDAEPDHEFTFFQRLP